MDSCEKKSFANGALLQLENDVVNYKLCKLGVKWTLYAKKGKDVQKGKYQPEESDSLDMEETCSFILSNLQALIASLKRAAQASNLQKLKIRDALKMLPEHPEIN